MPKIEHITAYVGAQGQMLMEKRAAVASYLAVMFPDMKLSQIEAIIDHREAVIDLLQELETPLVGSKGENNA